MMMYDNIHSGISDIGSVDIAGENESDIVISLQQQQRLVVK